MRPLLALIVSLALVGPALAQPPWQRQPIPGAYTRWPLPAAGVSQSGAPEVIFTFDDGPHETYTPMVLDELGKHGIKAIFFLVGWRVTKERRGLEARRALVERILDEGHLIANHTFNHEHLCKMSAERAASEIDDTDRVYRELAGMPLVFYRTPYGDHCKRLVDLLEERGLDHLHWDIDPMEWKDHDGIRVAGTLRRKMTKVGRQNRRAVIIMHDTRKATTIGLPIALTWLADENRRRQAKGLPPIRVLDGSDLAEELMDPGLSAWVRDAASAAADHVIGGLSRVVP